MTDSAGQFTARIERLWKDWAAAGHARGLCPARVVHQRRQEYRCVLAEGQIVSARVSGACRNHWQDTGDFPTVGDWVGLTLLSSRAAVTGLREGIIEAFLPRVSGVRRWAAGEQTRAQVIAANLDHILLVFSLEGGRNFLSSMVERSLTAAWSSGAQPVIVLNKADCASEAVRQAACAESEALAAGVPVCLVSAKSGDGVGELAALMKPGETAAMLGKSGVGKSSLVNAFFALGGNEGSGPGPAREGSIGGAGKGRHTTIDSQLYSLPWGAFIVDVPGLRELKIWGDEDDLALSFPDVAAFIAGCRFRNCSHGSEPGCAVQGALADGSLTERRYESYKKLQREIQYLEQRQSQHAVMKERQKLKRKRSRK